VSGPRGGVATVVFSGGRGSGALVDRLLSDRRIRLTLVINGYDDGASTGEVRRFLGDALGPSDFRKNAGRAARTLATAGDALIDLLDWRIPDPCATEDALLILGAIASTHVVAATAAAAPLVALSRRLDEPSRGIVLSAIAAFEAERQRSRRGFVFADCAVGNIVFAGLFLEAGRDFNVAVARYTALLGLPAGLIENVTDGRNAHLAALDGDGALLATEAAIVDAGRRNRIRSIHLLDQQPPPELAAAPAPTIDEWLAAHAVTPRLNPRLADRLREAALIVYAPGTQHSSLFPSYLTDGLGEAVADNQRALKVLVTNLQPDAETPDASGVDIVERALRYLRRGGAVSLAAPTVITHSLINEPRRVASGPLYVPPGAVDQLGDPRRAWLHDFEAGSTGRHSAPKVLDPFLEGLLATIERPRVALLLDGTDAADSVLETALELVRGGIADVPIDMRVYHGARSAIDERTRAMLPFPLVGLEGDVARGFAQAADAWGADYVASFDSSGMYWGEDLVQILAQVPIGRPAAIWGSRRLSVRDVHASLRLRYRQHVWLGLASYLGSHLLSLLYLLLYGRYVSDTLSAVHVVARRYAGGRAWPPGDPQEGHVLLSEVLRDQAELRELPVRFLALPSSRARRTRIGDGLAAIWLIVRLRLRRRPRPASPAGAGQPALAGPAA
jgi:2-phospho-L-lactate transferase/gluconeogenesis factor (CofD/UPF0052 family)